jgi:hypothetical protein
LTATEVRFLRRDVRGDRAASSARALHSLVAHAWEATLTMKSCVVCEGHHFRLATYDSPGLAASLPALGCVGCGSLELDDRRAAVVADALDAPRVTALRSEVQRLLDATNRYGERFSCASRGRRELDVSDDVLRRRIDGLRRAVLGDAQLRDHTLPQNDVD